jgi:hypothetical protein
MVFFQCNESAVLALATFGDTMKFERFLFVSNHSKLPRDVNTCCCCTWFSFNAMRVLYLPWLLLETRCNLKGSYLCHIIQGCQGMYIPVAVSLGFLSMQWDAVFTLATLGDMMQFEMFLFLSHHSGLPRDAIPVALVWGFHHCRDRNCTCLGYLGRHMNGNVPICVGSFKVTKAFT